MSRIARVLATGRTVLAAGLRRAVVVAGGRRTIVALGGAFLLLAYWMVVVLALRETPLDVIVVLFVMVAAPAIGLLVGGSRLPRADVHRDFYPTIAGWSLAGIAVMLFGVALYDVPSAGGLDEPTQAVPVLLALAAFAGFAAGVHDARARTRARELEHRNRQLERTREELESTVVRLRTSNERLEQFAYAASHDLQEPLRMVSSYLQLVESRYGDDLDDDGEEYLEFAIDGADRMRAMIDGLLTYSRVETEGQPLAPIDLEAVVDDVCTDLQLQIEQRDAEIEVGDLPRVEGDASQLRQVFQNLLDNAIEYSGDEPPHVRVTGERDGDRVEVAVADDGIGIDPEHTDRVFEVFQRLHSRDEYPGTGIGLALCQRIVDRHGGEIWVESEPGEGSTFRLSLPAVTDDEDDADGDEGDDADGVEGDTERDDEGANGDSGGGTPDDGARDSPVPEH